MAVIVKFTNGDKTTTKTYFVADTLRGEKFKTALKAVISFALLNMASKVTTELPYNKGTWVIKNRHGREDFVIPKKKDALRKRFKKVIGEMETIKKEIMKPHVLHSDMQRRVLDLLATKNDRGHEIAVVWIIGSLDERQEVLNWMHDGGYNLITVDNSVAYFKLNGC